VTFPAGLATIEVTGLNLLQFDGTPLEGVVIFSVAGQVPDPALSLLLQGSAVGEVAGGVMDPLTIPTTDCVSPGFVYTIIPRLQTSDGVPSLVAPLQNVAVPSAYGDSVDLAVLVPGAPPPAATAFGTANTWAATQTFLGSPPAEFPAGLTMDAYLAPDVVTLEASGSSVPVDAAAGNAFDLEVGGNWTIQTPSSPHDGQVIRFRLLSGGAFALSWASGYDFGTGSAPGTSQAAGKLDIAAYEYAALIGKWCYLGAGLGYGG
jgi:hypothetical protein